MKTGLLSKIIGTGAGLIVGCAPKVSVHPSVNSELENVVLVEAIARHGDIHSLYLVDKDGNKINLDVNFVDEQPDFGAIGTPRIEEPKKGNYAVATLPRDLPKGEYTVVVNGNKSETYFLDVTQKRIE